MKSEDLGVILADRGMFEDHMPTQVLNTLRAYHKEVSSENREQLTKELVEQRRKNQMSNEIRNFIEKRDIQLERGNIQADSTAGIEEVDGGLIDDEVGIKVRDEVNHLEEVDGSQEVNWVDGAGLAEENGVIVIEENGEERNIEIQNVGTDETQI